MGNVCGSPAVKDGSTAVKAEVSTASPAQKAVAINGTGDVAADHLKLVQQEQSYICQSVQAVKGDAPSAISISVAPAPPPEEYPEVRAAVAAAQREVKAGAKLKFLSLYTLGQVIGTGHYAR